MPAIWPLLKGAAANWQYVLIGVLTLATAVMFGLWQWERASCAAEHEAQARAVLEAQKKADALSNELVIAQAQAMTQIDQSLQPTRERIVRVPSTTVCRDSAPIRAAIDGVRGALGAGKPETK